MSAFSFNQRPPMQRHSLQQQHQRQQQQFQAPPPPAEPIYSGLDEGHRVIVRNLPWTLTGEELAIFVAKFGVFEHVDLMCHSDTLKSKGWGIVTFSDEHVARHVAQSIDGYLIDNRKIQAFLERDHTTTAAVPEGTNVFISNLPWSLSARDLHGLVMPFGEVVSIDLKKHAETGKSKGWGIIVYKEKEAAEAAIQTLNETQLAGRRIALKLDRVQVPDDGSDSNVYVGNLSFDITSQMLMEYFAEFCPISADVARTSFGNHRGFGIVKFNNPTLAQEAITGLHHSELCGRVIECRVDLGTNKPTSNSLYVGNLGYRMSDDELRNLFSHIGVVIVAQVQRRSNGVSKQWGRVAFHDPALNEIAVKTMDGAIDPASGNRITVAINRK